MKYKLLTLALLPIIALTLTACTLQDLPVIGGLFSGGGLNFGGPVKLKVWGLWDNKEVMDELVKKYHEKNPNVTIDYEDRSVLNLFDYKQAVFTRITGTDIADVVRVHNTWVPKLVPNLTPLPSGIVDVKAFGTMFYPVASEFAVFNNNVYNLPRYYDGLILVYNKNHFSEINQTAAPQGWEEFRRLATALTIKNNNGLVRGGAAMGTANNIDTFSDILGLLFAQALRNVDGDRDIIKNLDSKPAQDALSFYTNFVKEDGVWSKDFPQAATAFIEGKVSMIFIQSWQLADILNARDKFTFEVGVAPVPQALPETPASWASYWVDVVPKTSKNSVEAWKFLKYLSEEEQQRFNFSESSKFRQFGAPYSLTSLAQDVAAVDYLKPVIDTAPFAESSEIAGRAGNKKQVDALAQAISDVLGDGVLVPKTSEEALKAAKDAMLK